MCRTLPAIRDPLDAALVDLLSSRLCPRWAPFDLDQFSQVEETAFHCLVWSGLAQQRITVHAWMAGFPQIARLCCRTTGYPGRDDDKIRQAALELFPGWLRPDTTGTKDEFGTRIDTLAARLTARGEKLKQHLGKKGEWNVLWMVKGHKSKFKLGVEISEVRDTGAAIDAQITPKGVAAAQAAVTAEKIARGVDVHPEDSTEEGTARPNSGADSAVRADNSKLFPGGVPDDPDILDLVCLLDQEKSEPEGKRRSNNAVARDFCRGHEKKAQCLLRQVRRLIKQGTIKL